MINFRRTSLKSPAIFLVCVICGCSSAVSSKREISHPLSAKEISAKAFAHFDRNGDNKIDEHEYANGAVETARRFDRNQDGKVTKEELGVFWSSHSEKADKNSDGALSLIEIIQDQDLRFKQFDKNKDGYLSEDEFEKLIQEKIDTDSRGIPVPLEK